MAKSPEEMKAAMISGMKEKTGKTLAQWLKLAAKSGKEKHGEIVKHLKTEHGLTHGFANLVTHEYRAAQSDAPAAGAAGGGGGDALIEAQYAGPKAALQPIYDALVAAARKLGSDVEIAPKKTYVSLRRSKQFALIQPSTRTRVDLGLQLKGVEPDGRLEASGSFNSMVSHRVRLTDVADVNAELKRWLKAAWKDA